MAFRRIVLSCYLLVFVATLATEVRAELLVTNADQWDGQYSLSGPTRVWGQTFTAPGGHPVLDGVSFWLQSFSPNPNPQIPFEMKARASIVAWDGQKATGPLLGSVIFDDPEYLLPSHPEKIDFDFSPIELVDGKAYVAIIEGLLPSPGQLYLGFISSSDSLPGSYGGPYAGSINNIRSRPWTIVPNGDLVMEFRYAVPEPSALVLAAVGAVALVGLARRNLRRRVCNLRS